MKLVNLNQFADKVGMTQNALNLRIRSDFLAPKPKRWASVTAFYSEQELIEWHTVYEDMLDIKFRYREEFNGIQL